MKKHALSSSVTAPFWRAMEAQAILSAQLARHPEMAAQDAVKLIFQSMLGCGHLVSGVAEVEARIRLETEGLLPCPDEPLYERIGDDYLRVNLRPAAALGILPGMLARMMVRSAQDVPVHTRQEVAEAVRHLHLPGAGPEELDGLAGRLTGEPAWLPGHSERYRAAYRPAYRVVASRYAPVLKALEVLGRRGGAARQLITIDGPCGSGKSTLAALLGDVLQAPVIPMDDFYVPHAQKTPERLARPGGNADLERLLTEVLNPWQRGEAIAYRPYICREDRLLPPVMVPCSPVTILEGSYSNLPAIARLATLRLFLTVGRVEQLRRLRARDGEAHLPAFQQRWIPLEEMYFRFYSLPDGGCTVLSSGETDVDTNCCV